MLLDKTHIRIGCEGYVHSGRSRGAATLLKRNISLNDGEVRLRFRGKGGREIEQSIVAPALARAIDELRTIPGRRIFQYRDEVGRVRVIRAGDVNGYLGEVAGAPVTAKDFRALAANAEAARRLAVLEPHARPNMRRRQVAEVIRQVADLLGNTPAIARKSYVHGELVAAFTDERLAGLQADRAMAGRLPNGEKLVAALFSSRASSG
jgi:DNA topoisomerase-1